MAPKLHVRLVGAIHLRDDLGRDCTPRGAKARGLVALLALSPDRKRTRRWLEAKLWSDRGPEQASGSLRQTLLEVRAALGNAADALVADRESIGFTALDTDLDADPQSAMAALASGRELMEGIDLRDQAFEAWLREQRQRFAPGGAGARAGAEPVLRALPLLVSTGTMPQGLGGFVALTLADAIGALISEFASVDVYGMNGAVIKLGPQERGLALNIEASEAEGQLHIYASLSAANNGRSIWSRHSVLPLRSSDPIAQGEFPAIVFEAAEAAMNALPRVLGGDTTPLQTEAMVARAVKEMFSFDASRIRLADTILTDAARLQPSAKIYAWHGLLRQIMFVERTDPDRARLFAEADTFVRKAMEGPQTNPLVLALASQVRVMIDENAEGGAALARDAIALSPNNAFAFAAQAGSLLRSGHLDAALTAARHGSHLASRSSFLHWWESLSGLAAVASGDYPGAIAHYEAARLRAPHFRSPLRHLLFLYLQSNQVEKAMRIMADLQQLEPDFSLERIRQDPSYPAATLRAGPLIRLSLPLEADHPPMPPLSKPDPSG
ncbi:MAG: tetratricopeptide repeat protein [Paracoccaceae bacterium]